MNFNMVGALEIGKDRIGKDGNTISAYNDKDCFDANGNIKGAYRRLNLSCKCGKDIFFLEVGGYLGNIVYSLDKDNKSITFPKEKRNEMVSEIANFRKYVFVDGEDRYEFTTQYDLALCVYEKLQDDFYKDKLFRVDGEVEISTYKDKTNKKFVINRIYVTTPDKEQKATISTDLYVSDVCVDDSCKDTEGVLKINGYVPMYSSDKKKLVGDGTIGFYDTFEYVLSKDEELRDRQISAIKNKLRLNPTTQEGCLSKTGIQARLMNRTNEVEFTEEMLTEDEALDIELGLCTFEDIKNMHGGGKSGDYIRRSIMTGFKPKYLAGTEASTYTIESLTSDGTKKEELIIDFSDNSDDPFGFNDLGVDDIFN